MFKVSHRGNGFLISIGDHRPAQARDIDEVREALYHYYGGAPGGRHIEPVCPFCRQIAQRSMRYNKAGLNG